MLLSAHGGTERRLDVENPLGTPISARFALLPDGTTAVVEAAQAVGLDLMARSSANAERASTRGVGQLIVGAARAGASRVVVAVGGTATSDGGAGAVDAVREGGGIGGCQLVVLCDVRTPFELAARVFAPQKGADRAAAERLRARLGALAARYERDPRRQEGGGAGGGLAGGLWAGLGATLVGGASHILDALSFDRRLRRSIAVVVGEGKLDDQTERGKAIDEICRRASRAGVPAHAIVGRTLLSRSGRERLGLSGVVEASTLGAIEAAAASLGPRLMHDDQAVGGLAS